MARLSIIIPAFGSQNDVDDTLLSVLENRPSDCDVHLIHPANYVDPYDLGDEVEFVVSSEADLLSLCNAGFQSAGGEIVHCLRPGMVVSGDWTEAAMQQFSMNRNIGSVAPQLARKRPKTRPVQGVVLHAGRGALATHRDHDGLMAPLSATGFFRGSALRFMRGYDLRFGPYADIELGMRMRAAGYEHAGSDSVILAAEHLLKQPIPRGYHGGKLRGELSQLALDHGLARRPSPGAILWGELLNNRWSPRTLLALLGRLHGSRRSHGDPAVRSLTPETAEQRRKRRAA